MFFAKIEELSKVKGRVFLLELTPEVSVPCTILTYSSRVVAPVRRDDWCKHDLLLQILVALTCNSVLYLELHEVFKSLSFHWGMN